MSGEIEARIAAAGIEIPEAPAPAANYVPYVVCGNMVFISGQVPFVGADRQFIGKVGKEFTLEEGREAARVVALNLIAQVRAACGGDLERVVHCAKLGGFVNCTPDFVKHPQVINGASDLMVEVFGDKGRHARFAVGAPSLPFDVAVEIDAVFEIA